MNIADSIHLKSILKKVNAYKDIMRELTDNDLKKKTSIFKSELKKGKSLDDILPEAFAVVREADYRILGLFPFDVQVIGGIVMHEGNIAEMKTGEGKTLTATMPLYLNALSGESTLLITSNEYLAKRDAAEMGQVYEWLGLKCTAGIAEDETIELTPAQKREIYHSDIVYTTSSTFGFDYLIDNLGSNIEDKYMRPFGYAIVDEIDEVLLDSAQTPLVISGAPRVQSNMYILANNFIVTLIENEDFETDKEEKNIWLTPKGIGKAQSYFRIPQLYSEKNVKLIRHLVLALRANWLLENGKDYIVRDGEIKLLDKQNGRVLEMTKLQSGLHQAIETKEGLEATTDMRAMASITFQNLFRMFKKLGGMTETAKVAQEEFIETYYMKVIQIPTNRKVIREDFPDRIYATLPEKLVASLEYLKTLHQKSQPVLLVTGSVEMSEIYSELLLNEGIPHSVLNAKNAAREAKIISEAGQYGAVTVATVMAGRGTDIKLGKGVNELGGLAVIGVEKMISKRIELQLRGRAGRQGDSGQSIFFISMEDELVLNYGTRWMNKIPSKKRKSQRIKSYRVRMGIKRAQKLSDDTGTQQRRSTLEFDESSRVQRESVYAQRNALIYGENDIATHIQKLINKYIEKTVLAEVDWDKIKFERFIFDNLSYEYTRNMTANRNTIDKQIAIHLLKGIAEKRLRSQIADLDRDEIKEFYQKAALKAIDDCWIDEVDSLQQLRAVVSSRQYAQRNPVFEYHKEAMQLFQEMRENCLKLLTRNILLSSVLRDEKNKLVLYFN